MSSILEALRKLEEEKAARRGAGGNIAGKVASASRRSRQRPAWHLPAGVVAVAAVAVLATYAAMGGFSPHPAGTFAGKGTERASVAASVPSLPADRGNMKPAPLTRLPAPEPEPVHDAVPRTSLAPIPAAERPSPLPAPQRPYLPAPSRRESPPAPAAQPSQPVANAPFPELNVTGIAWQKDSAARIAVVNGVSVTEGGTIEGARVREILPDRVIFSFDTREFQVSLGKEAP